MLGVTVRLRVLAQSPAHLLGKYPDRGLRHTWKVYGKNKKKMQLFEFLFFILVRLSAHRPLESFVQDLAQRWVRVDLPRRGRGSMKIT